MEVLEELTEEFDESLVGGKAAGTVANSLKDPFFSVRDGTVTKLHDAMPEEALEYTETAKDLYQQRDDPTLNIQYHGLVRTRAELLQQMDESEQAREEVERLRDDLEERGVNQPVLEDITAFSESL